jgi:SPP1 gp7 family putative phage head morphogenesis protein
MSSRERALRPNRPNIGISNAYSRKLLALTDEMARSYIWFVRAQYRRDPPEMAMDISPAKKLEKALKGLFTRWQKSINDSGPKLANWFAKSTANRSDAALRKILRDAGYSVRFKLTPAAQDILDATVAENVALIKSIHQRFHNDVAGLVMRAVVEGGDISELTEKLRKRYKLTRSRAKLIAFDQTNKMTSAINRARQLEVGITEGIWLHSHAGNEPRPTHLANHGERFSLADGWFDPDPKVRQKIWPDQLINCKCTWKPVVKGFS